MSKTNKKRIILSTATSVIVFALVYLYVFHIPNEEPSSYSNFKDPPSPRRAPASQDKQRIQKRAQENTPSHSLIKKDDEETQNLLSQSLGIYAQQTKYQYTTLPLHHETSTNPLLRYYRSQGQWSASPDGEYLRGRLLSSTNYYFTEKEAHFQLETEWEGQKVIPEIKAELLNQEQERIQTLTFSSEGLTQINLASLEDGIYYIRLQASYQNENLYLMNSFSLNTNTAQYLRSELLRINENRDLELESEWKIPHEGVYLIETVLTTDQNKLIAAYEKAFRLKEGTQKIKVIFDGYYLYSKHLQGSIKLEHISLSSIGNDLEIKRGPLTTINKKISVEHWGVFRTSPTTDPVLQEKVKLLTNQLYQKD